MELVTKRARYLCNIAAIMQFTSHAAPNPILVNLVTPPKDTRTYARTYTIADRTGLGRWLDMHPARAAWWQHGVRFKIMQAPL